jgi:hypothetical protein
MPNIKYSLVSHFQENLEKQDHQLNGSKLTWQIES